MPNADDSIPPSGPPLLQPFETLVGILNSRRIRYAIIGGIAIIQALRDNGFTVDVIKSVQEFRDSGLTSVQFGDIIVDLMQPILPVYSHVLDRAFTTEIRGQTVRVSSAEGLIVTKLIAMRPQDELHSR